MIERASAEQRFWGKVDKSGPCWEWTAARVNGYGRFGHAGKVVLAHRWAWQQLVGLIPSGLELDHMCRNPGCVNPSHMETVPHIVNVRRGRAGWNTAAKTHCPQGHPYSGDNLLINKGRRVCIICKRAHSKARYKPKPRTYPKQCPQGHEYTPGSTAYRNGGRHRYCRECDRRRSAKYAEVHTTGLFRS